MAQMKVFSNNSYFCRLYNLTEDMTKFNKICLYTFSSYSCIHGSMHVNDKLNNI